MLSKGRKAFAALILLSLFQTPLWAVEPADSGDQAGEIVIRVEQDKTLYEYRINGELVQVRVVPKIGPEYYLIPQDDGSLRRSDRPRVLIPSWKLLEW
ncbi:DUF2782 domain-containing protein [Hahella sp. SMD15-11]|uniref:DUF2782 domain-containing protein n=1 Tax=Thermohahella caldifontis TaxID=3142973 RepID=A0AB39UTH1_9GAMM